MKAFKFSISGNWAHFKKPETNNNPLSHDLITKTALIGMIGAVLGIERQDMKALFPKLSEDIIYGVQLNSPVKKVSLKFTSKKAVNPVVAGSPKAFEFLKNPSYIVILALKDTNSEEKFNQFKESIKNEQAIYTPVLGLHNCTADLKFLSEGEIEEKYGEFTTSGFVIAGSEISNAGDGFRIGFDNIPTYQNEDFWNEPDRYEKIIYPDYKNELKIPKGKYYAYKYTTVNNEQKLEQWNLI